MFKKQSLPVVALSLLTAFALTGCNGDKKQSRGANMSAIAATATAPAAYDSSSAERQEEAAPASEEKQEAAPVSEEKEEASETAAEAQSSALPSGQTEELPGDLFQKRDLEVGKAAMDVFIDGPRGSGSQRSGILAFVNCDENPIRGAYSGVNGITVLPGSRIALKRDLDYRFGDGGSAAGATPNSVYTCNGDRAMRDTAWFEGNRRFRKHVIKAGSIISEMLLSSPNGAGEPLVRPVMISCHKSLMTSAFSEWNGISLTPGSQIILARKPGKAFPGYSEDDNGKFAVISCE